MCPVQEKLSPLSLRENYSRKLMVSLGLSHVCPVAAGGSTPPGISAPTVTSIPSPISVNGFTGMPPPQANGQPPAEAVFTNGIHHYPGKSDNFKSDTSNVSFIDGEHKEKNFSHFKKIFLALIS